MIEPSEQSTWLFSNFYYIAKEEKLPDGKSRRMGSLRVLYPHQVQPEEVVQDSKAPPHGIADRVCYHLIGGCEA